MKVRPTNKYTKDMANTINERNFSESNEEKDTTEFSRVIVIKSLEESPLGQTVYIFV